MDVTTENKVVPRLRFDNFNNFLESKKLNEVVEVIDSLHQTPKHYAKEGYTMIRVTDVEGELNLNSCLKVSQEVYKEFTKRHKPKLGDIIISRVGTCGASIILKTNDDVCLGQNTVLLNPHINSIFLHQLIRSNVIQKQVSRKVVGSTQKTLSLKDLKKFSINIPQPKEQNKIAEFLSSVDKKIQMLEKKKELLEEYKKGVMQKIFYQEIRFKDDNGNSYPDWEKKKLGDIGEFKSSSVDKKIKEGEELVFLINYMNVYNHEKLKPEMRHKLMRVSASSSQILSFNLKKGDILFTPSSETPYDIGRSSVIFSDLEDTLYSYHLMRFRPSINLNLLYSHYFCNISPVLRQLSKLCAGSTRFTISVGNFSKVQIELPCLGEQKKIADFLSAIDSKIETTSTKIDKTKEFKKGLLQQMFV